MNGGPRDVTPPIGRLSLILALSALVLVFRGLSGLAELPGLAALDLCVLAMGWRLWEMARRRSVEGFSFQVGFAVVAAAAAATTATRFYLTHSHWDLAALTGILAIASAVILSPALFASLATGVTTAWVTAAVPWLGAGALAGGLVILLLGALLGGLYTFRRSRRITLELRNIIIDKVSISHASTVNSIVEFSRQRPQGIDRTVHLPGVGSVVQVDDQTGRRTDYGSFEKFQDAIEDKSDVQLLVVNEDEGGDVW